MSAIALTGGIATGKSTVAQLLAAHAIPILDTDAVAAEISGSGGLAIPALIEAFGREFLTDTGALDRARMRNLVFADAAARSRLEGVLHPLIRDRVEAFLSDHAVDRCAVAIPLYFETLSYTGRFGEIVAVDCVAQQQRDRLIRDRNLDAATAEAILRAQVPRVIRLQLADRVLTNNADISALGSQVTSWVKSWC